MMSPPLLSVKQLSVAFAKQHAWHGVVDQVSFELRAGECVALVGESGSGKSLTGLAILQLLPLAARVVRDSQICFNGVNLLGKSEQAMQQVRGVKIGMIFQDALAAFNPVLTIGAQLQEVLAHVAASAQVRYERALACLARVGLQDPVRCYHAYPHQLSGGMRQRAMIAMALAGEPQLIIADEPTTALDVALQAQIIALLQELKQRDGLALLFITHDLAVAAHIADRVVVMQSGKVVEQADATTFFKTPTTAYAKRLLSCVTQQAAPLSPVADAVPELSVQDLKVTFRASRQWWWQPAPRVTAVDGVSLTIWAGQTHALVGESGSGKSTLARSVARLLKPTSGRICFEQQDEWRMRGKRLHQLHKDIQMIFQDPYTSLNPRRVIFESVSEGLKEHRLVTTQVEMLQRVDFWLTKVGLPVECKWRYPHEFSGGERQRLCIARALAVQPKVLILDEPTSALDVSMQAQILTLLSELQQELGVGYLLITHDLAVVRRMAHYVSVMHQGRVVETGAAASVLLTPQQAYTQRLVALMPSQIFNA